MIAAAPDQWLCAAQTDVRLDGGTLQIWRVTANSGKGSAPENLLGPKAMEHAQGMADPLRRAQHTAGHVLLDELRTRHGSPLCASLSHSGPWVIAAAARSGPVGIDVESLQPGRPIGRLSERFFPPHEHAWLQRHGEDRRTALFYALWTAKEALLKALGRPAGMPHFAARPVLEPDAPDEMPARLVVGDCQVGWFPVAPGFSGAFAAPKALTKVQLLFPESPAQ